MNYYTIPLTCAYSAISSSTISFTTPTSNSYTYKVGNSTIYIPIYNFTYSGPSCSDITFTYGITPAVSSYSFITLNLTNNSMAVYTTDNTYAGNYTFNITVTISTISYTSYYLISLEIISDVVVNSTAPYFLTDIGNIVMTVGTT